MGINLKSAVNNLKNKATNNPSKGGGTSFTDVANDDPFFGTYKIDEKRWATVYPYQLIVIDSTTNSVVSGDSGSTKYTLETTKLYDANAISLVKSTDSAWVFTLPITPQQLRITDLYAINLTPTARGIVEEHNGVKFKKIRAAGTTGLWPKKPTIGEENKSPSFFESAFAGTVESAKNVIDSFNKLVGNEQNDNSDINDLTETGYYQAMLMGQFLERYAMAKKDPSKKNWRLCFHIPKQNKTFVVKPDSFVLKQDASRPNLYYWEISLTAYGRINLDATIKAAPSTFPAENLYTSTLSKFNNLNNLMSSSLGLISSVKTDFNGIFDSLRLATAFVKSIAEIGYTLADLPNSIKTNLFQTIEASLKGVSESFKDPKKSLSLDNAVTQSERTLVIKSLIVNKLKNTEGGALTSPTEQTDELNKVKSNPNAYFGFFDSININDLELTPEQENAINDALEEVKYVNIDKLNEIKATLKDLYTSLSNVYGLGDPTYSKIYNLPLPKQTLSNITLDDLELLQAIMEAVQALDDLTATTFIDDLNKEDSLSYISSLANDNGIEFNLPQGKKLVPVPFGLTIEEIAARYLKDANRWIEIATINNLRSPYIDEVGFSYNLLSNGQGRSFNIDDSQGRLFVGQKITLSSDTVPPFVRKITEIEKIGDNNYLVTVDGESNLSILKSSDSAKIHAYLPGTTNSQNRIYIPIDGSIVEDDKIKPLPSLENTQINKLAKVDFLLTEDGDLAINSIGDFRLSTGLTNLIQALKMKLLTKKGALLSDLTYGLTSSVGSSIADTETDKIVEEINTMIAKDPRFEGLNRADVILDNNTLYLVLEIELANGGGIVPLNFEIN